MSGVIYMAVGSGLLLLSFAGFAVLEWMLSNKKKKIREQTYQMYDR